MGCGAPLSPQPSLIMKKLLRKARPLHVLQLFMSLMYIYSGFDLIARPQSWELFVPEWLYQLLGQGAYVDLFLQFQGFGELVIALLFLPVFPGKRAVKLASCLTAIEMVLILVLIGIDHSTFRDIGLLGAALCLFIDSLKWRNRETHH